MTRFYETNKRYVLTAAYVAAALLLVLWLQPLIAGRPPARIIQTGIQGVLVGGVYALIALGIVIINKASGVFNFAHGVMMVIGGFLFFSFFNTTEISIFAAGGLSLIMVMLLLGAGGFRALLEPRLLAISAGTVVVLTLLMTVGGRELRWLHAVTGAVVGSVLLGLVIERFTIRPLIGQPVFAAVMVTLALGQVLSGITQVAWGTEPTVLPIFGELNLVGMIRIDARESMGANINIDQTKLVTFGLSLAAFAVFVLFFRFTNIGLAMRATAENQQLAQSVGLRVRAILAVAWGIAALLAGTAGVLQGSTGALDISLSLLALRAFPAVLLGGLESIGGALVGGLVIGLTEQYAILLFNSEVGEQLAPYVVLMIVLVIRPDGLFGQKRIERV